MRNIIDFTIVSHGIPIKMEPEKIKLRQFVKKTSKTILKQINGKENGVVCSIQIKTGVPYTVIIDTEKF